MNSQTALTDFITRLGYDDLPTAPRAAVARAVLDLLSAMVAGQTTASAGIMAHYAASAFPGGEATVIGRGKVCNQMGAALANACAANALDVDDGYRPAKGHPGAVIIPAALAVAQAIRASGSEFLSAVVVGYEIGTRAGVAWHADANRGPSFHCSGSWGSVGAAAACAHLLGLDADRTAMALGIAEYHAPLAPAMAVVGDPAMVKDAIPWGALVGINAAHLASEGFTGIRSILSEPAQRPLVQTLGSEWWIERLYYKFFPCCRWTQPALACVLELRRRHNLTAEKVASLRIDTFDAATRISTRRPTTTEAAQFSLPYPVACALVRGKFDVADVTEGNLADEAVLALSDRIELTVDPALEARFPAEALASVTLRTTDGRTHRIGPLAAPGDADDRITFEQLAQKSRELTVPIVGEARAEQLIERVAECAKMPTIEPLAACLAGEQPVP